MARKPRPHLNTLADPAQELHGDERETYRDPTPEPSQLDQGAIDLVDADELIGVLDQLDEGGNFQVRVYKWGQLGNEQGWLRCGKAPAANFDVDEWAERFGPGKYHIVIYGPAGQDGQSRIVKHSYPKFAARVEAARQPAAPAAAAVAASPGGDVIALYGQMMSFQQNLILAVLSKQAPTGPDPASLLTPMIALFREGRESASKGGGDLEAFRAGIDLAREVAPGGEGDGGGALMKLAPALLGILDKTLSAPRAPAPVVTAPAAPALNPAPPVAAIAPPVALPAPIVQMARRFVPLILAEARADRDPFVWGEWAAERCPDEYAPALLELAEMPTADRMALLSQISADLAPFEHWIEEAAEAIKHVLSADEPAAVVVPIASPGGSGSLGDGASAPVNGSGSIAPPESTGVRGAVVPGVRPS